MKTIERKREQTYFTYMAVDGTEFMNQAECEVYEQSAKCAVRARLSDMCLNKGYADSLLMECCSEASTMVLRLRDEADLAVLRQYVALIDGPNNVEHRMPKEMVGKVLVVNTSCDDDWTSVYDLDEYIKVLTNGAYTIAEAPKSEESK